MEAQIYTAMRQSAIQLRAARDYELLDHARYANGLFNPTGVERLQACVTPRPRPSFGGELRWPTCGPHRLGRSVYGPYPLIIAVVSLCRCEPLRAGCCGGEGV